MRFEDMIDQIICGDAIEIMRKIPDGRIDVVGPTSPPYWGLRDYGEETTRIWGGNPDCGHEWDNISFKINRQKRPQEKDMEKIGVKALSSSCIHCDAWYGQLGLEPHPQMYINHLVQVFREVKRILKKSGSFWLNMGDTYYGSGGAGGDYNEGGLREGQSRYKQGRVFSSNWLQPKQLMLIPSRLAIALQDDGWILRNDIVWAKPNPMPSSVKDRLNTTWEHLFHFVKNRKYYYDLDAIREPYTFNRWGGRYKTNDASVKVKPGDKRAGGQGFLNRMNYDCYPHSGKNPGDVIKVPSSWGVDKNQEYHGDGKQNPKGQSPSDLKRSIVDSFKNNPKGSNPGDIFEICTQPFSGMHFAVFPLELIDKPLRATLPKEGITVDPFAGRGTVGRWCRENWGHYILIDISQKYCDMAYLYINGQKHEIDENQEKLGVIESDPKS